MNKSFIFRIGIVGIVCISIGLGITEFLSYKKVVVDFKQSDISIDIYKNNNDSKVTSLSSSSEIQLKQGSYYFIPSSEKFDTKKVYFTIKNNEKLEINPAYSAQKLLSLLKEQRVVLQNVLTSAYPGKVDSYIISDERLHHRGEWYSAKLIQRVSGGNEPDVYRTILNYDGKKWNIVVTPQLIINTNTYKIIPSDIIRQVNEPLSNEAYDLLYPM